jgi:hypothetical protein
MNGDLIRLKQEVPGRDGEKLISSLIDGGYWSMSSMAAFCYYYPSRADHWNEIRRSKKMWWNRATV